MGAAVAASEKSVLGMPDSAEFAQQPKPPVEAPAIIADRERPMKWWHEAKFGMFIHWGLYSILGRHEWVMEMEGIPATEYQKLATQFKPINVLRLSITNPIVRFNWSPDLTA